MYRLKHHEFYIWMIGLILYYGYLGYIIPYIVQIGFGVVTTVCKWSVMLLIILMEDTLAIY